MKGVIPVHHYFTMLTFTVCKFAEKPITLNSLRDENQIALTLNKPFKRLSYTLMCWYDAEQKTCYMLHRFRIHILKLASLVVRESLRKYEEIPRSCKKRYIFANPLIFSTNLTIHLYSEYCYKISDDMQIFCG